MRLNKTGKVVLVQLVLISAYAWVNGGHRQQRLIEEPVELPGTAR